MSEFKRHELLGNSYEEHNLSLKLTLQMAVMHNLGIIQEHASDEEKNACFTKWSEDGSSEKFHKIFNTEKVKELLGNPVTPESMNIACEYIAQKIKS